MTGQTISHYKILEKLGEGGMGVVYKVQDTKLDRIVALKFLPARLSASEQDKLRFIQEAKAASALNHPNVCTIHDIQDCDSQMFIVMEYVDGQTLREKQGQISFKQAIDVGIQVADGLAAAHDKGIIHRDIKPENIMVRKDGICQVMDFGLAKLRNASSQINRLTKEGSTVGTAGYMSPEQIQGQDADHRSDIFSFGVLLYELFAGQLPFRGVHETALAYEIVNVDPPPMNSIRHELDPALDAIVLECLEKEPRERTQSIAQISLDLKRFRRESSRSRVSHVTSVSNSQRLSLPAERGPQAPTPEVTPARKSNAVIVVALLAFFVLTTAVLAFLYLRAPIAEQHPVRFTIPPPEKGAFLSDIPIISPDGLKVAYTARDSSGRSFIWVRSLASLNALPLSGTDDASLPFWSPDNRFIGFFQNGKLRKVEVAGGPTQTIADAPQGRGATWGSAGVIVFAPNFGSGLQQVSEAGGTPTELTHLDSARREETHRWPSFLPDGRHFTYLNRSIEDEKTGLYLGSIDSKESTFLLPAKSNAVYASPGYLLFVVERSLMAQPFDAEKGQMSGQAFPIAEDVGLNSGWSYGLFSASTNGILVVGMGGGATGNRQFVWFDRTGKRLEKVGTTGYVADFALSPDEKRVAFRRIDQQTRNNDLWILDLVRQTESRFTFRQAIDDDPVWSPDGNILLFDSSPDGVPNLHQKIATGAGTEELLLKSPIANWPLDWSSDGRYILYESENPKTQGDLWIFPLGGDRKPFPFVQTEALEYTGRFSPDARWIVYSSNESGKMEVYVQAFPVTQGKWQVSTGGGGGPQWSKDGKEIFYVAPDKKLMAVDINTTGTSLEQGIPKPLFDVEIDSYQAPNRYAVSKDGKRFLVNVGVEGTSLKPIVVIMNWTAETSRK